MTSIGTSSTPTAPAILSTKMEQIPIGELRPYPGNARLHLDAQILKVMRSIERFGFINPILADRNGVIVAGHGRLEAAKRLGLKTLSVIRIESLSEAELRAYRLADNRLAELADWDDVKLAVEFKALMELDVDFDLSVTGFEWPEIDIAIQNASKKTASNEPELLPEIDPTCPPVSRPGDLWRLGAHRLICGDVRDPRVVAEVTAGDKADLVFTDPPYNVRIDGNVSGLGAVRHREFAMASGEMTEAEYLGFLTASLGNLAGASCLGSVHYVCMDWRHMATLADAGRQTYGALINVCVWVKTNGGMGPLYRSQHELVFVFRVGSEQHLNNVQLGRFGRNRSNVWAYPGVNTFRPGRMEELRLHPTVKPVALVADAILDCSRRGDVVLDGFAGSGTTILAAENTGRVARAIEIDPRYVDAAIGRWQGMTGASAMLDSTMESFDQVAKADRRQARERGDGVQKNL